jgi:hypothetical protein
MLKSFDDLKRGKAVRNGSIGGKRPAVVDQSLARQPAHHADCKLRSGPTQAGLWLSKFDAESLPIVDQLVWLVPNNLTRQQAQKI